MRLSARFLKDCSSVNSYESDTQWSWTEGDSPDLYLQLIDANLDLPTQGFSPSGRRYIPAANATLLIMIENIDDAKKVTRYATQPFPGDGSIWKLSILATDPIRGSPQLRMTLNESGKITSALVRCGVKVSPSGNF
jgi:hypothetical protein